MKKLIQTKIEEFIRKYNSGSMLDRAIKFAEKHHSGQIRKFNGIPYISHPLSVAKHLDFFKTSKNKEILLVCCFLHDVSEDCDVSIDDIRKEFGDMVASIVQELTNDDIIIKNIGKTEYLKNKMNSMSSYALCIKLCDRLDNLSDLEIATPEFRKKYISQTLEILNHIEINRYLSETHKRIIEYIRKNVNPYLN